MRISTIHGTFVVSAHEEDPALLYIKTWKEGLLEKLRDIAPSLGPTHFRECSVYPYGAVIERANAQPLVGRFADTITYRSFVKAKHEQRLNAPGSGDGSDEDAAH